MSGLNYAQIKKEYLVDPPKVTESEQNTSLQINDNNDELEPPKKKQKINERGQNKSRAKKNKIHYQVILCPDIARGRVCKFADKNNKNNKNNKQCKFSHDVQKFLQCDKPKDIGPRCIFFEAMGQCPQGYLCRFANAHIDDDQKLIIKKQQKKEEEEEEEKKNDNQQKYIMSKDHNLFTLQNDKFLRKTKQNNLKPFPITKQLMRYYKQFNDLYHPSKRRQINKQQQTQNTENTENKDEWEEFKVIEESNNYKLCNVFKFKDRKQTDIDLYKLQQSQIDKTIPNYYASLNLIDLEPRRFDIKNKLYLAPLTTVGNLPFRRICIEYGADITCGEMSMVTNMLKGMRGEWALCRRHSTEKIFGLQLAGGFVDGISKTLEYIHHSLDFEYNFIDLNVGCPLDEINNKRSGAALMKTPYHLRNIIRSMYSITNMNKSIYSKGAIPITCKMRTGFVHNEPNAKEIINILSHDGISAIGIHGRSRQQRYRRPANWQYIKQCVDISNHKIPIIGNGDIFNWNEWYQCIENTKCETIMIGRGALIKPWIFKEIKEKKHIDISSSERFDIIKKFTNYGLERWGSDQRGVDNTRRFLLEWLSFLCRYIPIGILEKPAKINQGIQNSMYYVGRNQLETLMCSKNVNDWIKITEMLLGPINHSNFKFVPKHKASAYAPSIIDDKNYILNDLGEVIRINNEPSPLQKVLNTSILGQKRKLNDT